LNIQKPQKAELILPARDLAALQTAINYGADAVYCGTPDLSLRTKSEFSLEDLATGIKWAHDRNIKIYIACNLFAHNRDLEKLPRLAEVLGDLKPDGAIVADPAVFQYFKEKTPQIALHISTQANVTSWLGVQYWQKQGAQLCVLAREISFAELSEIRQKCPTMGLEVFVHGSMCMTYSGRCLLSNYMAERGANQGSCAHSCRWDYKLHIKLRDGRTELLEINDSNRELFEFLLEESVRPGELMPIYETEEGSFILNSKDLCLMPHLNEYLSLGIDAFKVEGRHKNLFYVASVARAYRQAIDDWYASPGEWNHKKYLTELNKIQNRGYTLAFHSGRLTHLAHDYQSTESAANWHFAGFIREVREDSPILEIRNKLQSGDVLEFILPKTFEVVRIRLYHFTIYESGKEVWQISPGQKVAIQIPFSSFDRENASDLKTKLTKGVVARVEEWGEVERSQWSERNGEYTLEIKSGEKDFEPLNHVQKTERVALKIPRHILKRHRECCYKACNGCLIYSDKLGASDHRCANESQRST
jgi:putative protease